ncbi:MAG: DMT family transporter [Pseudomonadota bacterium]
MSLRELTVLLVMCLVWGFHFVVIKLAVVDIPPLFYAAVRMSFLTVLLCPFLRWRPGQMLRVVAAGLCLGGLNYAFMFSGLARAPASAAALGLELYVPFATILAVLFLGDRVGVRRGLGICLSFVGVALIALASSPADMARETSSLEAPVAGGAATLSEQTMRLGIGLITLTAMAEAIGAVLVKSIRGLTPLQLLAWFALVGNIVLWPASLLLEPGALASVQSGSLLTLTGAILYSALGASLIGHASYYWLLQRLPISLVAPSGLLTTVLAVFFAIMFLGERLTTAVMVGGGLVLGGVAIILARNSHRTPVDARPVKTPTGAKGAPSRSADTSRS